MLTTEEQTELNDLCDSKICTPAKWNRYIYLYKKSVVGATGFVRRSDGTPFVPVFK